MFSKKQPPVADIRDLGHHYEFGVTLDEDECSVFFQLYALEKEQ